MIKVTKATSVMPSPLPVNDDRPLLNWRVLAREPVVLTCMGPAMMAMMQMLMWRKMHCKLMMDQHRIWKTEGIVLESVKIGQYISDLENKIMVKYMQQQVMYLR